MSSENATGPQVDQNREDDGQLAHQATPKAVGHEADNLSTKGERLMKEFIKFRDLLDASSATAEQKRELWSQFLKLYTGLV